MKKWSTNQFNTKKKICEYYASDHYMLTLGIIQKIVIVISGSTIGVYTPAKPQENCSFIKYVLSSGCKQEAKLIKKRILQKIMI